MGRNAPASSSNGDGSIPGHGHATSNLPPTTTTTRVRNPPREKTVSQEALELLKKRTQRIIEADGLQNALLTGGLCLGCVVVQMRAAGFVWLPLLSFRTQCDLMKDAYTKYDYKMQVVKRSLRPPPKAKAKTAPKAAALPKAPSA